MSEVPFGLPAPEDLDDGEQPGGNGEYVDLRRLTRDDARELLERDRELVPRLKSAQNVAVELEKYLARRAGLSYELYRDEEMFYDDWYAILDPGVASTVAALVALGAVPVTSCNGGIFGDAHFERFPLVAFFAPRDVGNRVAAAAQQTGLILEYNRFTKSPVLSCLEIEPFLAFAANLIESHDAVESGQ